MLDERCLEAGGIELEHISSNGKLFYKKQRDSRSCSKLKAFKVVVCAGAPFGLEQVRSLELRYRGDGSYDGRPL